MKFDVFMPLETLLSRADCINKTIEAHSQNSRLKGNEIVWLTQQKFAQQPIPNVIVDAHRTKQILFNVVSKGI